MKLLYSSILLIVLSVFLWCCQTTKKTTTTTTEKDLSVTYAKDVKALMERSCTPCHFPETGKKKMLDTYDAVSKNIKDILYRVELPVDDLKYMPFKSKKDPFTAEEIELIKKWVKNGMPE